MGSVIDTLAGGAARALQALAGGPPVPYTSRTGLSFGDHNDPRGGMERAYSAYGTVGTLFAIVSQIGNAFARNRWDVYRAGAERDSPNRRTVANSGAMVVWNKPNNFMTGRFFRETVQQHLDLVGNGIIVLNDVFGVVTEMWPVRPDRVKPVKSADKFLTGYIYEGPNGEDVPLTLEQVIHLKYPNPFDPYWGMGPVQSILADIDAARYSAEWNRNFFVNGARPGGVIEVDYRMSDNEFKKFVRRWREQHQGVANAHRVAVLENAKWKDAQFSMADMQFVELRNLPRELIREAFAFPKPMLGTVDDVNRANADAGREIMAEGQTLPRLERWRDTLNTFYLPRFANGINQVMDFDDPTPINSEAVNAERDSQALSANKLVLAGYHPDDVTDAMGLPRMRYVGPPKAPKAAPGDGSNDTTTQEGN